MKTVIIMALSGGVDSTVALHLLSRGEYGGLQEPRERGKQHGRREHRDAVVLGATHIVADGSRCCDAVALRRACAACERYDVPFFTVDLRDAFEELVVKDFVATYLRGRTPNPCVVCNQKIRFDLFYSKAKEKLVREGFLGNSDSLRIATGHYARIQEREGEYRLLRGLDEDKDQSYMLYRIRKNMLGSIILPLGSYRKKQVKEMADRNGLFDVRTGESQDACFVEGGYGEFLAGRAEARNLPQEGEIVTADGTALGRHNGYVNYTVGQRRGLGLGSGPWYVTGIDAPRNRVVVGRKRELSRNTLDVADLNWLAEIPEAAFDCRVKVRYRSADVPCSVTPLDRDTVRVRLAAGATITPGQSAVFYDGERVLGGGIIR